MKKEITIFGTDRLVSKKVGEEKEIQNIFIGLGRIGREKNFVVRSFDRRIISRAYKENGITDPTN